MMGGFRGRFGCLVGVVFVFGEVLLFVGCLGCFFCFLGVCWGLTFGFLGLFFVFGFSFVFAG
jgi:hypothetical protein